MSIMMRSRFSLKLLTRLGLPMQERTSQQACVHDTAPAPSDLLNLHEIVAKARQNLDQNDWDYIVGGVGDPRRRCGATAWRSTRSRSGRGCCAT